MTNNIRDTAVFKYISAISKDLELSTLDLAEILQIPEKKIEEWFINKSISSIDDRVINFMKLQLHLNKFFTNNTNLVLWFKSPYSSFGGKSPISYIKEHPDNLLQVLHYVQHVING